MAGKTFDGALVATNKNPHMKFVTIIIEHFKEVFDLSPDKLFLACIEFCKCLGGANSMLLNEF